MNATIAKAVAAGIPVVMLNAGCDPADLAATKAITCVGQPENVAGQQAGTQLKSEGATNVLCVIHQSGQNLLDRCNGIAQALGTGSTCSTGAAPKSGPGCTELIFSTPNAASTALITALGTSGGAKVKIGTFDLDSQVVTDLQNGSLDFAIDQQQYLQGYLGAHGGQRRARPRARRGGAGAGRRSPGLVG